MVQDKLRSIIDQLIIFLRENPSIIVADEEVKRLELIIQRLQNSKNFSESEWELIKPINAEKTALVEKRISDLKKDKISMQVSATRDMNQHLIKETEKMKQANFRLNQKLKLEISGNKPTIIGYKICKKCNEKLTVGEYEDHIKKCKSKK